MASAALTHSPPNLCPKHRPLCAGGCGEALSIVWLSPEWGQAENECGVPEGPSCSRRSPPSCSRAFSRCAREVSSTFQGGYVTTQSGRDVTQLGVMCSFFSLSLSFFFFSLIGIDFDSQVTQAITGELRVELAEESLSKHLTFKEVFISGKKISDFIFVQAAQHLLKG